MRGPRGFAEGGKIFPLPGDPASVELLHQPYPNRGERTVRMVRDLVAIVALLLASLLMMVGIQAVLKVSDGLERLKAPTVTETACSGEEWC